jgi:hypothetical protein
MTLNQPGPHRVDARLYLVPRVRDNDSNLIATVTGLLKSSSVGISVACIHRDS